jgi:ADP-heptose:LPS heptosyltransferase
MPVYSSPRRIAIARKGALGDVLDTTPIVARLIAENPDAEIGVFTAYPAVYGRRKDVFVNPRHWQHFDGFDLRGAMEKHLRQKHPVDCYSLEVFGDEKTPHRIHLVQDRSPCVLPEGLDFEHCIAIHPARTWPQRTQSLAFWQEIVRLIRARGWQVMVIGTEQDWPIEDADGVFNTSGKIDLHRQAFFIDQCGAFLCADSGPLSIAFATKTPVVTLLSMTLPHLAYRERFGKNGWGFYPIMAAVPCVGCSARLEHPVTFFECPWTDHRHNACVDAFDPETVVWKATSVARQHKEMERLSA